MLVLVLDQSPAEAWTNAAVLLRNVDQEKVDSRVNEPQLTSAAESDL